MLILKFELNADEIGEQIHGLSMGHITIKGQFATVTSKDRSPDQAMMIFISISDLLWDIRKFILNKRNTPVRFVGADSSFSIRLLATNEYTVVFANGIQIDRVSQGELVRASFNSVNEFMSAYSSNFDRGGADSGDRVFADLYDALEEFKELLEGNLN